MEIVMQFFSRLFRPRQETVPPYASAPQSVVTVELVRLRPDVLAKLEHELGNTTYIGPNTTELQVAYNLGVQAALKKLRDGFSI
jgi:hypothetical protein